MAFRHPLSRHPAGIRGLQKPTLGRLGLFAVPIGGFLFLLSFIPVPTGAASSGVTGTVLDHSGYLTVIGRGHRFRPLGDLEAIGYEPELTGSVPISGGFPLDLDENDQRYLLCASKRALGCCRYTEKRANRNL